KVPGVVGGVLVEPLHLAGGRVHGDLAGGVEAVIVSRVAVLGGPRPAIPRRGVAGTHDDGIGFRVEARALPGRTATLAPCFDLTGGGVRIVRPRGRPDIAGGRAVLAIQAAHVAFDEGAHPDFLAGLGV